MMDPPDLAGVAYDRHQHISAASVAGSGPAANIPAAICRRIYSAPVLMTCMTSIGSQYTSTQQYITADSVQGCDKDAHLASQQLEL